MSGQTLGVPNDLEMSGPPPSSTINTTTFQLFPYKIRKATTAPNMVFDLSETLEPAISLIQAWEGGQTSYEYVPDRAPATLEVLEGKLSEVISQLQELLTDAEEGDWVPPSNYAFWNSIRTVTRAYATNELEEPRYRDLPAPVTNTDDLGGVRVTWRATNRTLIAKFGANASLRSYLYFELAEQHGLESLSPRALSDRLRWLLET